jgi:ATP-dependent Clp protease ATP-binding subunit ClpA
VDDDRIDEYRQQIDEDEAIETTVRRLRRDGHSREEAVRILLGVLDLSLAEAKRVLLTHDTWAEAREAADAEDASPSVPPAPG